MSGDACPIITNPGSSFPIKPQIDDVLKIDNLSIDSDNHGLSNDKKDSRLVNGKIKHKPENGFLVHSAKPYTDSSHRCPCAGLHEEQSVQNERPLGDQSSISKLDNVVENKECQISPKEDFLEGIGYIVYESELQMPDIMRLITKDLSEPYSIYTYRYFIHNWPKLCFLAMDEEKCVGAIVCKLDMHKKMVRRGYIAMLAVDSDYRRRKIGSHLVLKAIKAMIADDCDEVVLETEITNKAALNLYENLGFVRDKRLFRYYLNGVDALRLKLWLR